MNNTSKIILEALSVIYVQEAIDRSIIISCSRRELEVQIQHKLERMGTLSNIFGLHHQS